jgi:hypothetical protein
MDHLLVYVLNWKWWSLIFGVASSFVRDIKKKKLNFLFITNKYGKALLSTERWILFVISDTDSIETRIKRLEILTFQECDSQYMEINSSLFYWLSDIISIISKQKLLFDEYFVCKLTLSLIIFDESFQEKKYLIR